MNNIFISYQNKDTPRSHLFSNALKAKGYKAWIYESHCHVGKHHHEQVEVEIKKCSAFVFIMSANSILSPEVTNELHIAYKEKIPIFPIYFNHSWNDFLKIKTDWEPILKTRTGISGSDPDKAINSLLEGLAKEEIYGSNDISDDTQELRDRIVPVAFSGSLDHFINRTSELESLKNCIDDDNTRFILLTGPGGYGKSALIEKLICELTNHYCVEDSVFESEIDSIVWVDFRAEEARTIDAIFNLVNKTFPKTKSDDFHNGWNSEPNFSNKLDFLFGRLLSRDRRLIILDNFESILDNTKISEKYNDIEKFINSFLNIDHTSIIIATSRRSLTLSPEIEGKHGLRKKEIIMDYGLPTEEAIDLIIDLDSDGQCHIEETGRDTLNHVVKQLNCVPRTLETLIGVLKNDERDISEFYKEGEFDNLIANPAKELINILKKEQKQIIEVLSIFNKSVKKEAIEFFYPDLNVNRLLVSLKRCFAVKMNENRQYYLHSIIQRIVVNQIGENDNHSKSELHKKAADWYATQHLDESKWLGYDDVQSVIDEVRHRIQAEEYDKACEVLNLIDREHLAVWNYYNLIVEIRNELEGKITDDRLKELNIGNIGCAFLETGKIKEAKKCYEKAIEISRAIKNQEGECRWLGNLAVAESSLNNSEQAEHMMDKAYQLAIKINDLLHVGRWQGKLANMKRSSDKLSVEDTIIELESALKITRMEDIKDVRFESYWLQSLYGYNLYLGNEEIAANYLNQAIEAVSSIGDLKTKAEFLLESFNINSKIFSPLQAVKSVESAFQLKLKAGRQEEAYNLAAQLAKFYLRHGVAEKAKEKYKEIIEFSKEVGNKSKELENLFQLGLSFSLNREYKDSISTFKKYKEKAIEWDKPDEIHMVDYNIGDAYLQLLDFEKSLEYLKLSTGHGDYLDFIAHYELAMICLNNENNKEADKHFNQCFKSYLKLDETTGVSPQFNFIYAIILVLRKKFKEAKEKVESIFRDKDITIYEVKNAIIDINLVKTIFPDNKEILTLEDMINKNLQTLIEKAGSEE